MANDVSREYVYADCEGDMHVDIFDEDRTEYCNKGVRGKLVKAMYGARLAAKTRQKEGAKTLADAGFEAGETSPCIFCHASRGIMTFLHGNGFVSSGSLEDPRWLEGILKHTYAIKTTIIGEDEVCKRGADPESHC